MDGLVGMMYDDDINLRYPYWSPVKIQIFMQILIPYKKHVIIP